MTFSVAGRCARTGMFGVAITTSSIAVGSRCPHVRAGVGAVATQNITDPQLAALVLDAMQAGQDSATAIANVVNCLLYTSPSPRDKRQSRMPSSA